MSFVEGGLHNDLTKGPLEGLSLEQARKMGDL